MGAPSLSRKWTNISLWVLLVVESVVVDRNSLVCTHGSASLIRGSVTRSLSCGLPIPVQSLVLARPLQVPPSQSVCLHHPLTRHVRPPPSDQPLCALLSQSGQLPPPWSIPQIHQPRNQRKIRPVGRPETQQNCPPRNQQKIRQPIRLPWIQKSIGTLVRAQVVVGDQVHLTGPITLHQRATVMLSVPSKRIVVSTIMTFAGGAANHHPARAKSVLVLGRVRVIEKDGSNSVVVGTTVP